MFWGNPRFYPSSTADLCLLILSAFWLPDPSVPQILLTGPWLSGQHSSSKLFTHFQKGFFSPCLGFGLITVDLMTFLEARRLLVAEK